MGNSNSSESQRRNAVGIGIAAGILVAVTGGAALGVVAGVAAHTLTNGQEVRERSSSNSPAMSSGGGGSMSVSKTTSPVWRDLSPYRGEIRTNGLPGSKRCYFTWDYTHNHIEKYNHLGKPVDAIHPITGDRLFRDVSRHKPIKL